MNSSGNKYYPTILGAAHLVILYIFIQTIVDFPLAIWDYYHGTEFLSNPVKKIVLSLGSILFILYFAYRKAKTKLKNLFPLKWFNPLIFIPMITFLAAAHVFLGEINREVEQLIPAPPWFWELFNRIFENDYGFLGAVLKVAVIAPIVEELIFRGVIMHGLMRNYPKIIAIFVSALFFALFHLNPWQFPATFLLGLLLGWVMVITRNIFACILGHSINNLLVLLSIEYWDEISQFSFFLLEQKEQLHISYLVAGISVVFIGLLATFSRKHTT
ncbi:CPBP family intramembrane glutamic endopeptidase [Sunxiuqinia indica]|uniref:CPBP family intramembrane glutamic endopeptidase n=1 Tax=Sunxiuqinia indica TaxID=2692584 RepID=UPI001358F7F3|nr:CPBP family intramembrane glutamic endopeptidase [Sunxiuqinia indica]